MLDFLKYQKPEITTTHPFYVTWPLPYTAMQEQDFILGHTLRVHPRKWSHDKKNAYIVTIVEVNAFGFRTHLEGSSREHFFDFRAGEWKTYHHDRFELVS